MLVCINIVLVIYVIISRYIHADPLPDINPYSILGFWCVPCPEGADCITAGQTIGNVSALEGYFMGFDGSGTVFLQCLNVDACDEDSECATGYTGDACTQCDVGLVLTDGYKCELCPDEKLTILVFLMGVSIFALYLILKLRSKRKGK